MTTGRFFRLLFLAILMAALGYGASYWYQFPLRDTESVDEPEALLSPLPQEEIEAQGRLEPALGTIAVSALPGEEIAEIEVFVGKDVKAGETLAILRSREIRELEFQLAVAREEQARAKLRSELALSDQRVKAALLAIAQAKARAREIPSAHVKNIMQERRDLASAQYKKLQQLRKDPATREAITEAELEQQQLLVKQLDSELEQYQNKLEIATITQKLAEQSAELELNIARLGKTSIQQADPSEVMRQTSKLAALVYDATLVKAPDDGKVLEIYARKGERIANTPILLMANLDEMICVAEVHEANLKDIEVKDEDGKLVPARKYGVTVSSTALDDDLHGQVIEVGRLIGAPQLRDPNPLARGDMRAAQVKIKLDDASNKLARRYVHLQVNVTIHLK